jgi:hypothetical protein
MAPFVACILPCVAFSAVIRFILVDLIPWTNLFEATKDGNARVLQACIQLRNRYRITILFLTIPLRLFMSFLSVKGHDCFVITANRA